MWTVTHISIIVHGLPSLPIVGPVLLSMQIITETRKQIDVYDEQTRTRWTPQTVPLVEHLSYAVSASGGEHF